MDFAPSPRAADLTERVRSFIAEEIEPVEPGYHSELAELAALPHRAMTRGSRSR